MGIDPWDLKRMELEVAQLIAEGDALSKTKSFRPNRVNTNGNGKNVRERKARVYKATDVYTLHGVKPCGCVDVRSHT